MGQRSVCMAERLGLPTSDHGVAGSNPAGGEILPEPKRHFIAQSLSFSPFHRLEMTEILSKGRKTLTHPSIHDGSAPTSRMCSWLLTRWWNNRHLCRWVSSLRVGCVDGISLGGGIIDMSADGSAP